DLHGFITQLARPALGPRFDNDVDSVRRLLRQRFLLVMEVKNMKRIRITLCLLIFTAIATVAMGGSAAAQTLVVGTGDPEVDVPAVQAAVDQGGEVILKGHFSFDRPPTVPTALGGGGLATILVSKAVAISGELDDDRMRHEHGEMTSIEGGTTPFYVEAPG